MEMTTVTLQLGSGIKSELDYLIKLQKQHGAPNQFNTVEELLEYVASAVADGARRPGAWERGMLDSMGLIPDAPESHVYRAQYGEPKE
jgi:hypothetical protein